MAFAHGCRVETRVRDVRKTDLLLAIQTPKHPDFAHAERAIAIVEDFDLRHRVCHIEFVEPGDQASRAAAALLAVCGPGRNRLKVGVEAPTHGAAVVDLEPITVGLTQ